MWAPGIKVLPVSPSLQQGVTEAGAVQTRPWEGKWINVRSARMLSSVMDAGFARIMNKRATKGTEARCLQPKQISKSYCTANTLRSENGEQKGSKQPLVLAREVEGIPCLSSGQFKCSLLGDAEESGVGIGLPWILSSGNLAAAGEGVQGTD